MNGRRVNLIALVVGVIALAIIWSWEPSPDTAVANASYDSLRAELRRTHETTLARWRFDSATRALVTRLEQQVETITATRDTTRAKVDSGAAAFRAALPAPLVPAFDTLMQAFALERQQSDSALRFWQAIAAANRLDADTLRAALLDLNASLANALAQVELERRAGHPNLAQRVKRDLPWYLLSYGLGKVT